jgi:hypothetical protein
MFCPAELGPVEGGAERGFGDMKFYEVFISDGMARSALHPDPRIRWINDQLPELTILGPLAEPR